MVDVVFTNDQFFMILVFAIWVYISSMGYEKEDIVLMWIQFFVALPLVAMLLINAFLKLQLLGIGVAISVLISSIYIFMLATAKADEKK